MRSNYNLSHKLLFISCFLIGISFTNCWESYELDLFDLVEEVGQNFYEVFGVSQDSDSSEIKKAYRKLSLIWHPDKNSDPGAESKFRQIVSIYDVLKDEAKRARYNKVLEFGLPDWRQPIYYFRRVRKLSLYELAIALSLIVTVGHYFVLWAQHFERKLTLEDRMSDIRKKLEKKQKKKKNADELEEIDETLQKCYDSLPSPSLKNTLPYRLSAWSIQLVCSIPFLVKEYFKQKNAKKKVKVAEEVVEPKPQSKSNDTDRLHLSLNPTKIEQSNLIRPVLAYDPNKSREIQSNENQESINTKSNKEWTDKQKSDLIKAIAKFPPGTVNRWNKVAEFIGRTPQECIQMEKQIKSSLTSSNHSNLNASTWNQIKSDNQAHLDNNEISVKDDSAASGSSTTDNWTQEEQKLLEKALKDYNKDTPNRWEKIAADVSTKSKEECINRFKKLCSQLKK